LQYKPKEDQSEDDAYHTMYNTNGTTGDEGNDTPKHSTKKKQKALKTKKNRTCSILLFIMLRFILYIYLSLFVSLRRVRPSYINIFTRKVEHYTVGTLHSKHTPVMTQGQSCPLACLKSRCIYKIVASTHNVYQSRKTT